MVRNAVHQLFCPTWSSTWIRWSNAKGLKNHNTLNNWSLANSPRCKGKGFYLNVDLDLLTRWKAPVVTRSRSHFSWILRTWNRSMFVISVLKVAHAKWKPMRNGQQQTSEGEQGLFLNWNSFKTVTFILSSNFLQLNKAYHSLLVCPNVLFPT